MLLAMLAEFRRQEIESVILAEVAQRIKDPYKLRAETPGEKRKAIDQQAMWLKLTGGV